ncbi:MAG: 2-isopropylmalate synthase [Planctomycetes bacterium]|nr:2-isopropylmalate synthase [Planctomycetota bacterium]
MTTKENDLIYDWNLKGKRPKKPRKVMFDDETLRDGLQSPSVKHPTIAHAKRILELMDSLGIDTADIGLPGAGGEHAKQVRALARHAAKNNLKIGLNCAARTVIADIEPVARLQQETGRAIEVCTFIGSSPIRQYAEDWTIDKMLAVTETALSFAAKESVPVMYVTEDTTRAAPETLKKLYGLAIDLGAKRVCVCDTVGHATPHGVTQLVTFVKDQIVQKSGKKVGIDWHGHRDRALDIINTIAALEAGADRLHGAAVGLGERSGNTPMDLLLVNLKLMGYIDRDLSSLAEYVELSAKATGRAIPVNYPVFGPDAFTTATGVHAAAVIKAFKKGDNWLADRIYSGVPAGDFGKTQAITIGAMSGKSNVVFWLTQRGYEATESLVDSVFAFAKSKGGVLPDSDVQKFVNKKVGMKKAGR